MNLRMKRYYPLVLLLIAILMFLVIAMGSLPITAYSI